MIWVNMQLPRTCPWTKIVAVASIADLSPRIGPTSQSEAQLLHGLRDIFRRLLSPPARRAHTCYRLRMWSDSETPKSQQYCLKILLHGTCSYCPLYFREARSLSHSLGSLGRPPQQPFPTSLLTMGDTKTAWSTARPFVNGGLSGMMATCIIQPIDMVKVRIQLGAQGNPLKVASDIIAKDGALLYSAHGGNVTCML